MRKIKYLGLFIASMYMILLSCSDMNDKHDIYMQNGEILYIGRVDSAVVLSGNERFILRYWITDPRAKELKIYWDEKSDSIVVPIPEHLAADSIEVLVGDNSLAVPEGAYTFQLVTTDGEGLTSVDFDMIGNVYGSQFEATLAQRFVKETTFDPDNNQLAITWGDPSSTRDIGVELTYYEGEEKKVIKIYNEDGAQTVLDNYNLDKGASYRTMFLPEETAIDTFFTSSASLEIIQNVALNKPTTTSSYLRAGFEGSYAVDGIITSASRWITLADAGLEHWIEIDLGKEYSLASFTVYKNLYNQYLIPNFNFQINVNGDWVNVVEVNNFLGETYSATFEEEIKTDKVRVFVPNYENNMVRIMEIEVYAKL
ncbi:DUF4998 domain-containing protein [Maribellus sp. YY47]|uniref:DUF4998 domain-containing protein n=1 Tax=Maribellus sp. YY47 TaxID=2929486 RepID=UPI002001CF24|nr:DUF4998 domain-containing protein [Maribellus sp. YY47]MCK3683906.1 discoidin domain-containing protein [Maribellus sp. YY47]